MRKFVFIHKNTSAVLTLFDEHFGGAIEQLKELVIDDYPWCVDNEEGDES